MDQLRADAASLRVTLDEALNRVGYQALSDKLATLIVQTQASNFWSDPDTAQKVSRDQAALERRVAPWRELDQSLRDVVELAGLGDASLEHDLRQQIQNIETGFAALKEELKFMGPYDDHGAILSIHA